MNRQITEVIIREDGTKEHIYRHLGPNGETHSQELQNIMAPCKCTICDRLMAEHSLKDFGDHLDQHRLNHM